MRIAELNGRAALILGQYAVDIHNASAGLLPHDIQALYEDWRRMLEWEASFVLCGQLPAHAVPLDWGAVHVGPPAPRPRQVFAIGLNYAAHADETQRTVPDVPMVFTKFASSIAGAHDDVVLPRDTVDYEAELVVVIGQVTRHVAPGAAWAHVAGLTVGQDLSERELQTRPPAPQQYCLAKSFPGFAPIGPVLVTPGSLSDPDDLEIVCELNGQLVQRARTAQMIFSVADLVAYLSTIVTLLPGDLIFTGTPSGIGWSRTPRLCLSPGDELTTTIEGIGTMSQRMFGHG